MEKLLTVKEVADRLGICSPAVIRLIDSGGLPAIEMIKNARRRFLRFRPEVVEEFIASHEKNQH